MNNKIGLIVSAIGIIILMLHIFLTAKNQSNSMAFLMPIGTLLSVGGAVFHILKNQKKE